MVKCVKPTFNMELISADLPLSRVPINISVILFVISLLVMDFRFSAKLGNFVG